MSIRVWRSRGRAYCFDPAELEPHLRAFTHQLAAAGCAPLSIESYVWSVAHFGQWVHKHRVLLRELDDHIVNRFAAHRCRCSGTPLPERLSRRYVRRVRRFLSYLADQGVVARSSEIQ